MTTILLQHQAVLEMDGLPDVKEGVKFHNPSVSTAPRAIIDIGRWVEMGHPREITITIHPGNQYSQHLTHHHETLEAP